MERQGVRILISLALIALGVLALLANLNVLPFALNEAFFFAAAFGVIGLAFLVVFVLSARQNWWAVIPGLTLLGLALLIGMPATWGTAGGALFLGLIGLSFWIIFFTHREFWWAVIPGGALLTLAGVALLGSAGDGYAAGGAFFLGLALTFVVVYFLPVPGGRMTWALWPAGVLGLMGALLMIGAQGAARLIWPLALMLFGGLMVFCALRPRN